MAIKKTQSNDDQMRQQQMHKAYAEMGKMGGEARKEQLASKGFHPGHQGEGQNEESIQAVQASGHSTNHHTANQAPANQPATSANTNRAANQNQREETGPTVERAGQEGSQEHRKGSMSAEEAGRKGGHARAANQTENKEEQTKTTSRKGVSS